MITKNFKFWHCWIENETRYTSCIVRYDCEVTSRKDLKKFMEEIKLLALQQLPHAPDEDKVKIAPIHDIKNKKTWHLCNIEKSPTN